MPNSEVHLLEAFLPLLRELHRHGMFTVWSCSSTDHNSSFVFSNVYVLTCHPSVKLPLRPEGFEGHVEGPQFSPYIRSALDLSMFAEVGGERKKIPRIPTDWHFTQGRAMRSQWAGIWDARGPWASVGPLQFKSRLLK